MIGCWPRPRPWGCRPQRPPDRVEVDWVEGGGPPYMPQLEKDNRPERAHRTATNSLASRLPRALLVGTVRGSLRPDHDRSDQRAPFQTHTSAAESGRPCMLVTITVCLFTGS